MPIHIISKKFIPFKISPHLKKALLGAESHEDIKECWQELEKETDFANSDLKLMRSFFLTPHSISNSAKNLKKIFKIERIKALESLGIPREFLLRTLYTGAINGMLDLDSDLNDDDERENLLNSYKWAQKWAQKKLRGPQQFQQLV